MNHGWFSIPGVQTGERDLKERIAPLKPLLGMVQGKTILDLGCAEGLIGKWLIDGGGATVLHGLDKHRPYLETATTIMPNPPYNTRFSVCDFDHFEAEWPTLNFRASYDVVLALNVVQKLTRPREFLVAIAALASDVFVYSGPSPVLEDIRSGFVPVNIEKELPFFKLTHYDPGRKDRRRGHLGVRMIFRRMKK